MKRAARFTAAILGCVLSMGSAVPAWAGENEMMDILIHKLVQKGVLSREDAREIKQEVSEEAARMAKARVGETKDNTATFPGGAWLNTVKWSGDLRLRHETERKQPAVDRNRERFRLRFGFVATPWDPLDIGVRLATGADSNPTSTNQTFTGSFDKKNIYVDQAYGKYTPWKDGSGILAGLSAIGGKMENPFVTIPEGVVWDGDVTPEGVALQWKSQNPIPVLERLIPVKPFVNIGGFAITEINADAGDPGVFGYQLGGDVDLPWWKATFQPAVAYYNFTGIRGISTANVTTAPLGNTTVTKGAATYFAADYNLIDVQAKLAVPDILGQPVALLANYTYNDDDKKNAAEENVDDDGAYTAGIEVGKVTEKFGSWQLFGFRKRVETDAAFGALSDSDFGGGGTNHKGYIMGARMGLNKWASVGVKYFRTDEIEGTQNRFDTFQADLQLKY